MTNHRSAKDVSPEDFSNSFNLTYSFGPDLKEIPADAESMREYAEESIGWINAEMEKPEEQWNNKILTKTIAEVGVYMKMLRRLDEALELLETALVLVQEKDLGVKQMLAHTMRWADILRFQGEFDEAESAFVDALTLTRKLPECKVYEDFALQHLGKLHFDMQEYLPALELFEQALVIRKNKRSMSLIESTMLAIEVTKAKLASPPLGME